MLGYIRLLCSNKKKIGALPFSGPFRHNSIFVLLYLLLFAVSGAPQISAQD